MIRRIAGLVVLGLLLAAPLLLADDPYILHILILSCIYAIPAIGLNLMLGYTGLVSLGHAAFAGIGGYAVAVLMVDGGWNFWAALPAATLLAGFAGGLIGALCLRLRSHYFIIVTLAFGLVLFSVMNNWDGVTRGAEGFVGIPRPHALFGIAFRTLPNFYYLALALTLLMLGLQYLIVRSDFGRVLAAIRQDETLAAFKGVDVMLHKVAIFVIGSAIAGFGGALKVTFLRVAAPPSFSMAESINLVLIVIVGGAGHLLGPVAGALAFVAIPQYLHIAAELRLVLFGLLLVVFTRYAPQGIAGLIARKPPRGTTRK